MYKEMGREENVKRVKICHIYVPTLYKEYISFVPQMCRKKGKTNKKIK